MQLTRGGTRRRPVWAAIMLAFGVSFVGAPGEAASPKCVPYATMQALAGAQLNALSLRLTFVGQSNRLLSTLVFTVGGAKPDLKAVKLCLREGFFDPAPTVVAVSASELRAVLDGVATVPALTAGETATDGILAFGLAASSPSRAAYETILDQANAAALFAQLRQSFAGNREATIALSRMACSLDLGEPGQPTDVSAGFTVSLSGMRLKRPEGTYVGTLVVTNDAVPAPPSPVSVVLDLPTNVTLVRPDGITCATELRARGFLDLPSVPAQGTSVRIPIEMTNPDQETLRLLGARVFAGPGAR